jgi:hypothetical protein
MNKPNLAILIAQKMKGKSKESTGSNKFEEMGQEILDAISTKDAKSLGEALKNFVKVCESDYSEDDEEDME